MPGVPPIVFNLGDFTTPQGLTIVNDTFEKMFTEINRLAGLHGEIVVGAPLNLNGNSLTGLADPVNPTDAVHLSAAQSQFGPAAQQKAMEATGNQMLQTVRRINDQQQREQYTSFLNDVLNLPPSSNSSTVTVVAAGANSTITVTGGFYKWADQSIAAYAQRVDSVANPGAGVNVYYYYLRKTDTTIQFVGPFTADNSVNQFQATLDGRGYIGKAVVNAAGGGTGGGGSDPPANGGCTEIGTPLRFPDGAEASVRIEPCNEWYEVSYDTGEVVAFAAGSLIGLFMRVNDDEMFAARRDGTMGKVKAIRQVHRESWKQVVLVKPQRTYWAGVGEWLTHNKILY